MENFVKFELAKNSSFMGGVRGKITNGAFANWRISLSDAEKGLLCVYMGGKDLLGWSFNIQLDENLNTLSNLGGILPVTDAQLTQAFADFIADVMQREAKSPEKLDKTTCEIYKEMLKTQKTDKIAANVNVEKLVQNDFYRKFKHSLDAQTREIFSNKPKGLNFNAYRSKIETLDKIVRGIYNVKTKE